MNEQKNMLLAVALSIAVLFGFNQFYEKPKHEAKQKQIKESTTKQSQKSASTQDEDDSDVSAISKHEQEDKNLNNNSPRIKVLNNCVKGSVRLVGAVIDDLELLQYKENTEADSKNITLLNHTDKNSYKITNGWNCKDKNIKLPDENTLWKITSSNTSIQTNKPITLEWQDDSGITFEKTISIDDKYMFHVKQKIINNSDKTIKVQPYCNILRKNPPASQGFFILHEGAIGYFNSKLFEKNYEDIAKENIKNTTTGGWTGFGDKFWLVSIIPNHKVSGNFEFKKEDDYYINSFNAQYVTIAKGESFTYEYNVFAGAKVLPLLDAYEKELSINHFDLAVDFGWFYFLTKPLFYVLEYFYKLLGNLGLAILLLTVLFKIALFPMANKSYRSMARLKNLQPKLQKIQNMYKDDKMRQSQELMNFYKKEKVNPAGGCLPMLIQAPIFFCLYKVLFVSIEMRHAPFFGWIHDLAAPDPTTIFNLFGLLSFNVPSFLQIGAWPLIMGGTMVLQQRLNPQPTDPMQAKMMMIMPIMFTYLFASFPAGLVVYWTWNNILSMLQQWFITRTVTK